MTNSIKLKLLTVITIALIFSIIILSITYCYHLLTKHPAKLFCNLPQNYLETSICLLNNGNVAVTVSDKQAKIGSKLIIYDKEGKLKNTFAFEKECRFAIIAGCSYDSRLLAVTKMKDGFHYDAIVYNIERGNVLYSFKNASFINQNIVVQSKNSFHGNMLSVCPRNGGLDLYDLKSGKKMYNLKKFKHHLNMLIWNNNDSISYRDNTTMNKIDWFFKSGKTETEVAKINKNDAKNLLDISPDGDILATEEFTKNYPILKLVNIKTGNKIRQFSFSRYKGYIILDLRWSRNGKAILISLVNSGGYVSTLFVLKNNLELIDKFDNPGNYNPKVLDYDDIKGDIYMFGVDNKKIEGIYKKKLSKN